MLPPGTTAGTTSQRPKQAESLVYLAAQCVLRCLDEQGNELKHSDGGNGRPTAWQPSKSLPQRGAAPDRAGASTLCKSGSPILVC